MKLKELINKSYYVAIGYVDSIESLDMLENYITHNLNVLKEFKGVIIATNYKTNDFNLIALNTNLWTKYFPDCNLIDLEVNRGHSFGTADTETELFNYCKQQGINWVCKSSNDVVFKDSILDKEIGEADFYYLSSIGVGGMEKYDYNLEKIKQEYFSPQTNFYFINVSKIDYVYRTEYIDKTYEYIQLITNYSGRIWEYIEGWSCENFLAKCVERNQLVKEHLIPEEKYDILLNIVKYNEIHDCSHKNIMIEGICHLQWPEKQIVIIK
jgi:hypothetical protein